MAISMLASPSASLYLKRIEGCAASAASAPFSSQSIRFPSNYKFFGGDGILVSSGPRKPSVVTYSNLNDLLAQSDKPVPVDFYATWPCQFMVPILNEVSIALKEKIQVVKIYTEKYPIIADKYRIEALPTFLFKDGGAL